MHVDAFMFGSITIDGQRYPHDVVVEEGRIRKRRKGPSKPRRAEFGHTPLTAAETLPLSGGRLWIGTGAHGLLPVAEDVREAAQRHGVELLLEPTGKLLERINAGVPPHTGIVIHVTC